MTHWLRHAELVALFVAAPLALAAAPAWAVLPGILFGAGICVVLLWRDPSFDRSALWRVPPRNQLRACFRAACLRGTAAATAIIAAVLVLDPTQFLAMPRSSPRLWVLIIGAYPLLSAYPQEIIFRTFFFHRYTTILRSQRARILGSTLAFSWAHVVLHNVFAMAATAAAGSVLATIFARCRSTTWVALEHAVWGCMAFSLGLGAKFYAGAP